MALILLEARFLPVRAASRISVVTWLNIATDSWWLSKASGNHSPRYRLHLNIQQLQWCCLSSVTSSFLFFFLQVIKIIYHVHSPWKHRYNFGVKCWIESIYNRKITGNSCWVTNVFKCWVSFGSNPFRLPRRKKWYFVQKQKKTFNYQNALQLQLYESHTICLSTGTGQSSLRQKKTTMFGISISFLSSLNMFNLLYTMFLPGQILRWIQKAFLHFYPLQLNSASTAPLHSSSSHLGSAISASRRGPGWKNCFFPKTWLKYQVSHSEEILWTSVSPPLCYYWAYKKHRTRNL